jgi:hypothetical protein
MSRIKIITRDEQIDEKMLTRYERQGLTLISVNHVKGSRPIDNGSGWEEYEKTTSWVYHFRIPAVENPLPHEGGHSSLLR